MKKKRMFIVGDSTACIYPHCGPDNQFPRTGWGQVVDRFLPEYEIIDLALSGRSSKSFKTEYNYRYLQAELSSGDYLLIQFGHNDSKSNDPFRYTAPGTEYKASITEYIDMAHRAGAAPILATSISRNRPADLSLERYVNSVRELAADMSLPMIDFYKAVNSYINRSGSAAASELYMITDKHDARFADDPRYEGSQYYDRYNIDNSHLNINGALFIAEFAADMIHELV